MIKKSYKFKKGSCLSHFRKNNVDCKICLIKDECEFVTRKHKKTVRRNFEKCGYNLQEILDNIK